MAQVSKSGVPSLATMWLPTNAKISGLKAGEDVAAGDACYVKASDGKVYRSIAGGSGAVESDNVDGFAAVAATAGEAVTLLFDCDLAYGSGLTAGQLLYVSASVAGGLATTATNSDPAVAKVQPDGARVRIRKAWIV